jgi:hypothetical protein
VSLYKFYAAAYSNSLSGTMSSEADFKLAAAAAGFTIGFGILTVWEAVKQTKVVRYPLRSHYVYMIWGEILVNLAIGIIAWLLVDGVVAPTYAFHPMFLLD